MIFYTICGEYMKKTITLAICAVCLCLTGCSGVGGFFGTVFWILGLLGLVLAGLRTYNYFQFLNRHKRRPDRYKKPVFDKLTLILYGAALVLVLLGILVSCTGGTTEAPLPETTTQETTEPTDPPSLFVPAPHGSAQPDTWGIGWELFSGTQSLPSYEREAPIFFGDPDSYFALPGICTFRGNNYRDTTSYGTAPITDGTLEIRWESETSVLSGTSWSGSGWTGQSLVVQWDDQTRQNMNLYPEKKEKSQLTEVIYATLDGHIYFLDLDDGSYTRDPIDMGMCFKGSGSLDPRGYPLMYVGAGDVNSSGQRPRLYVISLIDGSVLYEYGNADPLAMRRDNDNWCAFDSSPLVDAETDTLIWPGENGLLYTFRLNAQYDAQAGTVSVAPDAPILTRYNTARSGEETYWLGYEASASIVENYLYVSENGGMFYCVDLNTMALIWAQDTKDDSNASPVFERISQEEGYIYTAPSLHWTKDPETNAGTISLYKLDALTGQVIWEKPYDVYTEEGVSGGVQATPLLGKAGTDLEGLVIYAIARTPNRGTGMLVALDTQTGNEVWHYTTDFFAWSSPVSVYTDEGKGYVLLGDSGGKLHLLDGKTGNLLQMLKLDGNIEATPVIFEDMLILGTRDKKIYGIRIR